MASSSNSPSYSAPIGPSLRPNMNFFHTIENLSNSHQKPLIDTLSNYLESNLSGNDLLEA